MSHDNVTIYESLSTKSLARILDDFENTNTAITVVLDDNTLIGFVKEVKKGLLTLSLLYAGADPQPQQCSVGTAEAPTQPTAYIPIDKILYVVNTTTPCLR